MHRPQSNRSAAADSEYTSLKITSSIKDIYMIIMSMIYKMKKQQSFRKYALSSTRMEH